MNRVTCPICGRELAGPSKAESPQFPFCGERCRLIDLGRWLGENYRIPDEGEPTESAEVPEVP